MIRIYKSTVITISKTLLLVALIIITLLFIIGGAPFYSAPIVAMTVSIPVLINYLLIHIYKNGEETSTLILFWGFIGAYVVNIVITYLLIFMYTPGILSSNSVGPAEGYWLLFTVAGAIKFSVIGLIAGALLALIYFKVVRNS